MSVRYHVNKSTGRPNICRAEKRGCPLGANEPHFASKEEARKHFEGKNSDLTVPGSFTKNVKVDRSVFDSETTQVMNGFSDQQVRDLSTFLERHQFDTTVFEPGRNLQDYLDAYSSRPGCEGCRGDSDDYCDCLVYSGGVVNSPGLLLYSMTDPKSSVRWADFEKEIRKDPGFKVFEKVLKDTSWFDDVEVHASWGWYGEEIDSIRYEGSHDLEKIFEEVKKTDAARASR